MTYFPEICKNNKDISIFDEFRCTQYTFERGKSTLVDSIKIKSNII